MDLDTLQIELTASEQQAVGAIDALIGSLQGLEGAFDGTGEIKEFASALNDMSVAAKGINVKDFQKIPQAFAQLSKQGAHSALKQMADDLTKLNFAVSKYSETADDNYADGLTRMAASTRELAAAAKMIEPDRLKAFASAVNTLTNVSNKVGTVAQSFKEVKEATNISPAAAKEAENLANAWNIKDKRVIGELKDAVTELYDAIANGGDVEEAKEGISDLIRLYGRVDATIDETAQSVADFWRSYRSVKIPSDFWKNYGNTETPKQMRGYLGVKRLNNNRDSIEIDSVIQEMADMFPGVFDESDHLYTNIEKLVDILARVHTNGMSFAEALKEGNENAAYLNYTIDDIANRLSGDVFGASLDEFIADLQKANTEISITAENMKDLTLDDSNRWASNFKDLNIQPVEIASPDAISFDNLAADINAKYGTSIKTLHDFFATMRQGSSIFPQFAQSSQMAAQRQQEFSQSTQQSAQAVQQATVGLQDNPFGRIAEGLRGFEGINIPDMSNLPAIAQGIRAFGHQASLQAAANLPGLAQGLRMLDGLNAPTADYTAFAEGVAKLGRKTVANATMNIPFLADGLRSLKDIDITNLQGVGEIASAFSRLGGKNAEKAIATIPQLASAFENLIVKLRRAGSVSSNTVALAQALGNVSGRALSAGNAIQKATPKLLNFGKAAKNTSRHSFSLASAIGKIYAGYWVLFRAMGKIRDAIDISSSLTEVQNVVDQTFGDLTYKVDDVTKTSIQSLGMSELMLKQISSRYQAMGSAMGISNNAVARSSEFLSKNSEMYGHTASSMADMSLELTKLTADMASFYNMDYEEVAQKMEAIFTGQTRPLRTFGLDLTQATLQEWALKNGIEANMKTMSQAEKTMLRYQYVLANTAAAQGDFARTSQTWANQTRILGQQFQQLGAIIGGALINTIKPLVHWMTGAMNTIISLVQRTVNAIGKLMGWQMEISEVGIAMDDSMEDYGDSLDDATDSAKKLNRQLMAFDKLNVITTQKDNGKDDLGDALNGGLGDMGRGRGGEVSFKPYESDVKGWFDLGRRISDALAKAMEDIDWQSIYDKTRNFAHKLADFLNGLITPRLFEGVGRTLAGALNTAFHFLDEFGETFNFWNFGNSIAAGLNKFMKDLDWKTIFSAAKNWGKGIADAINGFISRADFILVGETIANALNAALEYLESFVSRLNFKGIGKAIADSINGFFRKFDFKKLARTLNKWARGILDAILTAIKKTDWDKIGKGIGDFLVELDFIGIGARVGKAIWAAINAGFDMYMSMFKTAPLETALLTLAGITTLLKVKPIHDFIGATGSAITSVLSFIGILTGGGGLLHALGTVFPSTLGFVNAIQGAFVQFHLGITSGVGAMGSFAGALQSVGAALSPVAKFFVTIGGGLAEFLMVKDAVHDLASGTGNVAANIAELLGGLAIGGAALTAVFGFPAGTIAAGVIGLAGVFAGMHQAGVEAAEAIDQMTFDNFIEGTKAVGDAAHTLDDFKVAMHNIVDTIVTPLDKLRDKLEEVGKTKEAISGIVGEFEALSIAFDNGFDLSTEIENVSSSFAELDRLMNDHINAKFDYLIQSEMADMAYLKATGRLTEEEKKEYENRITALYSAKSEMSAVWEDASGEIRKAEEAYSAAIQEFGKDSPQAIATMEEVGRSLTGVAETLGELGIETGSASDAVSATAKSIDESLSTLRGTLDLSGEDLKDYAGVYEAFSSTWTEVSNTYHDGAEKLKEEIGSINEQLETATGAERDTLLNHRKEIERQLKDIDEVYLYEFGVMQQDLVGGISGVIRAAGEEWDKNGGKIYGYADKGEYQREKAMEFVKNVVDPLDSEFKQQLGDLQKDASGYAKDASREIIDSAFDIEVLADYDNVQVVTSLAGNWEDMFDESVNMLKPEVPKILSGMFDNASADIKPAVKTEVTNALDGGIKESLNETKKIIDEETPKVGKAIPDGMAEGINSNGGGLWEKVKGVFSGLIDKVRGLFKTHSPSLVFKEIGGDLMGGMSIGITGKASEILNSIKTIAGQIVTTISDKLGSVKTIASEAFGTLKTNIDTHMLNLKTSVSTKVNELQVSISTVWQTLQSDAATKWNTIKTTVSTVVTNLKTTISTVWQTLQTDTTTKWNAIKTSISTVVNGLKTTVSTTFNTLKTSVSTAVNNIKTTATTAFNTMKTSIGTAVNGIKTTVSNVFNSVKTVISNAMTSAKTAVENSVKGIKGAFEGIGDVVGKVKDTVGDTVSEMMDGVKESVKEINDTITSKVTKKVEVKVKGQTGRIPRFASGGFPEDGLFFANHNELVGQFSNGRTAVANNTQIVEGIQSGVEAAVNSSMGRYLRYLPEIAETSAQTARKPVLSSRDVFSAVRSEDNARYQRTGQPSFNF